MEKILIYKLIDPVTNKIRYVGKTKNALNVRLSAHLNYNGGNIKLRMWIDSLKRIGKKPLIELIEVCENYNWCVREQYFIDLLIKDNDLLNEEVNENNVYFILKQYQAELVRMDYSLLTKKTYSDSFFAFMVAFKGKHPKGISKQEIIYYLQSLVETKKISSSYQNVIINSIKFFYEKVLGLPREMYYIKRPKREDKIRPLMTYNQVLLLINSIGNLKQKTCLQLMYSCALRSSEAVSIVIPKINFEDKTIHLYQGKGKHDRIVTVPQQTLNLIQAYIEKYKPAYWLFSGQKKGDHYSQRSLQIVFNRFKNILNFTPELRPHDLRGARLTHVMNNGVKIENAARFAGHKNVSTIYKSYYRHVVDEMQNQFELADTRILEKLNHHLQLTI